MRAFWLLIAACHGGGPSPCEGAGDTAATWACGGDGEMDLGTGEVAFEALGEGAPLGLHHGTQGLQHVLVALRASYDAASLAVPRGLVRLTARVGEGEPVAACGRGREPEQERAARP